MFIDGSHVNIKKRRHQFLGQPDGFILVPGFDALLSGLDRKDQELSRAVADQLVFLSHCPSLAVAF
jgi:hypothetical protein